MMVLKSIYNGKSKGSTENYTSNEKPEGQIKPKLWGKTIQYKHLINI